MFVKPNPDRTVRLHLHGEPEAYDAPVAVLHPHTRQPIPAEGVEVPEDVYWMRALRDGDLVLAERSAEGPKAGGFVEIGKSKAAPDPEPATSEHDA